MQSATSSHAYIETIRSKTKIINAELNNNDGETTKSNIAYFWNYGMQYRVFYFTNITI